MGERSEFIGTKDVIEELMINALFRTIVSEARSANLLVLLSISYSLCPIVKTLDLWDYARCVCRPVRPWSTLLRSEMMQ